MNSVNWKKLDLPHIVKALPEDIRIHIMNCYENNEIVKEIRVRVNRKVKILTNICEKEVERVADKDIINEILEYATGHSMYAYEGALKNGYITVNGGHRIGIAGQAVMENGRLKTIKNISSINIRFANEMIGCADNIINIICNEVPKNTLIISPPGYGKTTLLRDIIRQVSGKNINGHMLNVSLIDERSEIASSHKGVPQNDIGECTDVLDGCPKAEGMMMLLRTMSPDVLAIDELGLEEDIKALKYITNCGCNIFATIHGNSIEDIKLRSIVNEVVKCKIFDIYIVLGQKNGGIESIYDKDLKKISDGEKYND